MRSWETVFTTFLRTQPLHAASAVVHAHRQSLGRCTGDPAAELVALRQAADAWTGALELAELVGDLDIHLRGAASAIPLANVASSHILQHLCALRLDLAEALTRVGEGQGEEAGEGGAANAEAARQLSKRLAQADTALLELVAVIADGSSSGGVDDNVRGLAVCVEMPRGRLGGVHAELRSALSHAAVQCLLGWWLVAPGAAAGGGGGRAWGLPGPLLRHVGAMGEQGKLCVRALKSAALCWEEVLKDWGDLAGPPPEPAAPLASVAVEAAGNVAAGPGAVVTSAAEPGSVSVSGRVLQQKQVASAAVGSLGGSQVPGANAVGPTATAVASVNGRPVYSPDHVHRMCMAALRHCCSFPEYEPAAHIDKYFEVISFRPAVNKGLGVLIGSLLLMPPARAARRLASVWQVLLQSSKAGLGMYPKYLGLRIGQLLGESIPHLQQREQQQEQPRSAGAEGACGEPPGAVQRDLEVTAGGEAAAAARAHLVQVSTGCPSVTACSLKVRMPRAVVPQGRRLLWPATSAVTSL